jgi:metal-responsive CopG/Arc/MetJ family transcriptional regulator
MVQHGDMNRTIDETGNVVRASISFPHDIYDSLEKRAYQRKVSIAWIVRDAVESYLGEPIQEHSLSSLGSVGKTMDTNNV